MFLYMSYVCVSFFFFWTMVFWVCLLKLCSHSPRHAASEKLQTGRGKKDVQLPERPKLCNGSVKTDRSTLQDFLHLRKVLTLDGALFSNWDDVILLASHFSLRLCRAFASCLRSRGVFWPGGILKAIKEERKIWTSPLWRRAFHLLF